MKNKISSLLLIIVAVFVFSQCSDDPANPSKSTELMPLKPGNSWIYSNTYYDLKGKITNETTDTSIITQEKEYEGLRYFQFLGAPVNNTEQGFCFYRFNTDSFEVNILFKYPANSGDEWVTNSDTIRLESTSVEMNLPIGNVKAYKYLVSEDYDDYSDEYYYYFCPGIGFIAKDKYYHPKGGNKYLMSSSILKEYKLVN